jgi:hypothetical protein
MRQMILLILIAAAGLTTPPAARAAEPPPAVAEEAKAVPISQVLVALSREGREAWDKDKSWPTTKSDFAQRRKWKLTSDEVLVALSRRLNPEPAVDGYVKWQLLSFLPDFKAAAAEGEIMRGILTTMPRLTPQPEPQMPEATAPSLGMSVETMSTPGPGAGQVQTTVPPGTSRLGVVSSGTTLRGGTSANTGGVTPAMISAAAADHSKARKAATAANVAPLRYRDALVAALPEEGGTRLAGMLKDTWDRIAAGDPTYSAAVDRVVAACQKLKPDSPIPATVRASLAEDAEKFRDLKTSVIESFQAPPANARGNRIPSKGYVAQFPPEKLKIVLNCLRGEEPPKEK